MNRNQDSLRKQILDAMNKHTGQMGCDGGSNVFNATIFDEAIMPVLEKAMAAGELLLHRATTPQAPVPERVVQWLEGCLKVIAIMHQHKEITADEAMAVLAQLEDGARRALADVKQLQPQKPTKSSLMGRLLAGKPLPMKG